MAITSTHVNKINNGLVGSTVSINTGAAGSNISPLTIGPVYTTSGTAGQFLTSSSNGSSWSQTNIPNTHFNSSNGKPVMTIPYGEDKVIVEEKATLEVKGNVVINGIDLEERLKTIEKVLMIPERDATMEKKYPSLKKKFDEYINALEKYKTFERIKGDYDN